MSVQWKSLRCHILNTVWTVPLKEPFIRCSTPDYYRKMTSYWKVLKIQSSKKLWEHIYMPSTLSEKMATVEKFLHPEIDFLCKKGQKKKSKLFWHPITTLKSFPKRFRNTFGLKYISKVWNMKISNTQEISTPQKIVLLQNTFWTLRRPQMV